MTESLYPITTIDLLRHGECVGGNMIRGSTDSPLSQLGFQQMKSALNFHSGWQQIVSSPLLRCRQFAEAFARDQQLPVEVIDNLQEIHFGDWEGLTPESLQKKFGNQIERYYRNPESCTPPNGESLKNAQQRFSQVWTQLLMNYKGKHLLAVVHGGTVRILLSMILHIPLTRCHHISVPLGGLTRVRVFHTPSENYPQLLFHQMGGLCVGN